MICGICLSSTKKLLKLYLWWLLMDKNSFGKGAGIGAAIAAIIAIICQIMHNGAMPWTKIF